MANAGVKSKEIIAKGHFNAVILQKNSMGTIIHPDTTMKYVARDGTNQKIRSKTLSLHDLD
jgi:hypothetical protein